MLTLLLLIVLTSLYIFAKRHYSKWERLGFESDKAAIPLGSMAKVFHKERSFGLVLSDIYYKCHEKVVGIYLFFRPALLIRDAELARQILTSDFNSFHDRGFYVDEKHDPMSANLFTMEGQSWRSLRMKLTPSFSSGKLKGMFDTVDDVADKLISHLAEKLEDGKSHTLEIKSILTTYAIDIIGSVIFGLEIDSFSQPNNEFRVLSDRLFNNPKPSMLEGLRNLTNFMCPPIAKILSRLGAKDPVTYRLRDIVKRTIEFREEKGVVRKDLLQLFIQLRNTGKISDDSDKVWKKIESTAENLKAMSIDMIASNAFLFYVAGSETTSATISFTIYELAMYPEILKKAQNEVDEVLRKHNLKPEGRLTYEAIQDLKYLDLCVMETTRKYPGLPFLNRHCTQTFKIPDSKLTIENGTSIIIPIFGIHRDAKYFPNPTDYRPERFAEDSKDYNPVAYMPFGEGPRHCIAQRMGVMNSKIALAKILANFYIQPMPRKEVEFKFHTAPVLVPVNGLNVGLSKRW
ncbi:cytochrome P450 6d1-like [Musca vetustissima]|uniref:cytochrome P450 6d1-like n=1 Tax=Musca vetustissima TaxID=27455 RepID=UPI002AB7F192|nr:cytochrome P450 6d1-like [Musca vetustissima]